MGNQNPYIEEEPTTQWPKEKEVQKDKNRQTKHTYKTKDRVTRTPLKTGVNSGAPEGQAVKRGEIDTYNTQIHNSSPSWLVTVVTESTY